MKPQIRGTVPFFTEVGASTPRADRAQHPPGPVHRRPLSGVTGAGVSGPAAPSSRRAGRPRAADRPRVSPGSAASARSRRSCAARSAASAALGSRPSATAASRASVSVAAPAGTASSAATRPSTAASSSAGGTSALRQPDRHRLRRAHPAPGQADLDGARVADRVHQRVGAAEVGNQPERRLGHAELHVVGDDAQVTGQRELEAGPDGVAVHGGDGHPVRLAQPAEAGLEAGDGRRRRPGRPARRCRRCRAARRPRAR